MEKLTITAKELSPGDQINIPGEGEPYRYVMVGRVAVSLCCGTVQIITIINGILHDAGTIGKDVEVEVLR